MLPLGLLSGSSGASSNILRCAADGQRLSRDPPVDSLVQRDRGRNKATHQHRV